MTKVIQLDDYRPLRMQFHKAKDNTLHVKVNHGVKCAADVLKKRGITDVLCACNRCAS